MGHDYNEKQFPVHIHPWFTQGMFPYSHFFWLFCPWVTKCIHLLTLHEPLSLFPSKESHWKHKVTWTTMGTISILGKIKRNQLWVGFGAFWGPHLKVWKVSYFLWWYHHEYIKTSMKKRCRKPCILSKGSLFLTSKISPKSEIKNQTFKNEFFKKGFNHQKWEKNTIMFFKSMYLVCCMCSQIYKRMIKDYFIFGL